MSEQPAHTDARAEAAILSHAEAYRLVEEARQMREERDAALVEIGDLSSRLERETARRESAEAERDRYLMALSSAQEQGLAFKRQRDEVVKALSDLYTAVVILTNADPTHYEVANTVALPAMVAMQLVERYQITVPSEAAT